MVEANPGNGPIFEGVPERRVSFEERYESGKMAERTRLTEDQAEVTYAAYAVDQIPGDIESAKLLSRFVLDALQAGYTEATDRFSTPEYTASDGKRHVGVIFFLEQPTTPRQTPSSPNPGARGHGLPPAFVPGWPTRVPIQDTSP